MVDRPAPFKAKPTDGSTLLFGALTNTARVKELKNDKYPGSYRMVLKSIDEMDWFTDRPNRVEGSWKQQKLIHKWDKLFAPVLQILK